MPRFIRQMFIVMVQLCFGRSLGINCLSMNNPPWMIRPTLFVLSPDELHWYSFMFSIKRCNGSCNTIYEIQSKGYMDQRHLWNISYVSVEAKLIVGNVTCDKNQKMIRVSLSVKKSKTSRMRRKLCLES